MTIGLAAKLRITIVQLPLMQDSFRMQVRSRSKIGLDMLAEEVFLTGTGDYIQEQTGSVNQTYSGPYSPKKQVYKKSQEGTLTSTDSWTSGYTANGYRMIRYADVLLMIAECQIETNAPGLGQTNINLIREEQQILPVL